MEQFDQLLKRAHELGIKLLLDFVPNHASNESEYFIESEARNPIYEDFFIWDDGIPDPENPNSRPLPPSNWVSVLETSRICSLSSHKIGLLVARGLPTRFLYSS
ncbi:maltase 1-like [Spodoptera litura]|uniref:alpha-glucosidase n=1 Tax=Spodoptera litura TaxID=69820 RepID=A0A9J7EWG6_SPOLT|nr:maltase 1-like [Spodoptera litura]